MRVLFVGQNSMMLLQHGLLPNEPNSCPVSQPAKPNKPNHWSTGELEIWADTELSCAVLFSSNWKHYFSDFSLAAARKSFSPSSSSWSRFSSVWYSPAGTFDSPCKSPYRQPAMRPVALLSPVHRTHTHTNTHTTYQQFTFRTNPIFLINFIFPMFSYLFIYFICILCIWPMFFFTQQVTNISDYKIATLSALGHITLDRWWVFVTCWLNIKDGNMFNVLDMN